MVEQLEPAAPSPPHNLGRVLAEVRPVLLRIAQKLCGNPDDAHDLVQETCERALRQGIPADVRNPRAWLTTAMHNKFIDQCRAKARQPGHEPLEDQHDNVTQLEPDSPEPAWYRITRSDIQDAVQAIEPVYREVYLLHTFEHQSYEQIAKKLAIQRVTVGTRLNRARKKLREVLVARFDLEDKP